MSVYIETDLRLDSFDLILIENLVKIRIKDLREFKKDSAGLHAMLADEQIGNYNVTMKKIKAARAEVARIKAEGDAEFAAKRTARKK